MKILFRGGGGGGGSEKNISGFLWGGGGGIEIFVDIFFWGGGVTSELNNFYGLFLKSTTTGYCGGSVLKFTFIHNTTVIKQDGHCT